VQKELGVDLAHLAEVNHPRLGDPHEMELTIKIAFPIFEEIM